MTGEVEIELAEVEEGIFDRTDYRLDLKFYSSTLKASYAQLSKAKYPMRLVKDVADVVDSGVKTEDDLEYKYLQISDIDGGLGEVSDYSVVQGIDLPSRAKLTLSRDNLVISSVRPLLREIAIVPEELDGEIGTNGFIQIRCRDGEMEPEYLLHILRCRQVTDELDRRSGSLNYPAISEHDLMYIEIPCPPIGVRESLIKRFSNATVRVKKIKDEIERLQQVRNRVLASRLRNGGVATVPKDVEFSIDEAKTKDERLDVKFYRYSRKHPFENLSLEAISPKLGEFSKDEVDLEDNPDTEFTQVTVSRKRGVVLRERNQGKHIGTKRQIRIHTGEIVVSRIDLYNGCVGIVPEELDGAIVTRDFMVFKLDERQANPTYFVQVLKDEQMADYFYAFAVGATGRKRISQGVFRDLKIPVLDSDSQREIELEILGVDKTIEDSQLEARVIYGQAEAEFMESLGVASKTR